VSAGGSGSAKKRRRRRRRRRYERGTGSTVTNASGCDVLVIFARCPLSYSQCPVRDNTSDQREAEAEGEAKAEAIGKTLWKSRSMRSGGIGIDIGIGVAKTNREIR
jgi:hypothetical protein